jgi:hypothetical protein
MNKLLQKIAWKTRRWNLKVNLLDIYLHDGDGCWGFTLLEVVKDFRPYSLLSIEFRLPNGAEVKRFTIDNWDFLFLSTPIWKWVSDTDEREMWTGSLNRWDSFWLKTLSKLYK